VLVRVKSENETLISKAPEKIAFKVAVDVPETVGT
jgi:hypothetical protein